MTSLAVVAYPALAEDDRRWIEGVRARHDPLALRVAAHFTLVFPTEVAEAPVPAQVEALSDGVLATHRRRDIPFMLRWAVMMTWVSASGLPTDSALLALRPLTVTVRRRRGIEEWHGDNRS